MKIGIQTWGTDGDVLPLLALAGGLRAAEHEVTAAYTIVDNKDYSELCARMNFNGVRVFNEDLLDDTRLERIKNLLLRERWPAKHLEIIFRDFYLPAVPEMWQVSQQLCTDNDLVIGHWGVHTLQSAAELSKTPHVSVLLNHSGIPSRHVTPFGVPRLGKWLNPMWWNLVEVLIGRVLLPMYNPLRHEVGLPPYRSLLKEAWESKILNLIGVSPALCLRPPDWPDHYQVCGFLDLPVDLTPWRMPDSLQDFLAAGNPPVYMTFGSMTNLSDEYEKLALADFISASRLAGCRAIIQTKLAENKGSEQDDSIYLVDRLPHKHVFPRCAAVVHHGGTGTTQSALLGGRPSVVVAHIADQPFWGAELNCLGIAPKPLMRQNFSARKLARAIRKVLENPGMGEKAARIGQQVGLENGTGSAARIINKYLEKGLHLKDFCTGNCHE